jgi:hypothetical protein
MLLIAVPCSMNVFDDAQQQGVGGRCEREMIKDDGPQRRYQKKFWQALEMS